MKNEIAEIISEHCIEYQVCGDKKCSCYDDYIEDGLANEILSLFKNIQVEVDCLKCKGTKVFAMTITGGLENIYPCLDCQRTGKITRPATLEEMEIGGILREVKG